MKRTGLIFLVLVCAFNVPGWGQRQMSREDSREGLPAIGDRIPDLQGWDENGRMINLRDLKGDYKVLIFGCLT